ncbi:type 4b pilus Flp biogenesis protein TadG [Pseudomonas aeruginosa]|uniref:type 4b pilus Flp biogenesis protein TadG n=1 Tax=Pseudomonas aeruginosa TaxID=287 RepID=UPI000FF1341F|nr:type 4b pilus Flp biogenesis protein TadG [Pseudomonas aeruginosa]MBA5082635.1 type 4b pilus Flp biogenesis protein TadG [Pseudomonas aeruginosa]MCO3639749.1 type 4b pilus Flp biogenesis protein TadG [Pseudomonas aeruginosa]MDI2269299.1 type 4b pilus Flp biogenesis protein TadG [Pseudomonas aeruginosa]MDI2281052.1 type 4b pilus Flp biogenesis protein TadG [Pseudomonas aeruginosa]MDI2289949.1 type 4b pilus Flp biogenesis protein TadG [Pseudomonas aeruginosa]
MNGWPARQRGAIGILAATTLLLALICLLLVVDTGRLYLEQRNLQRVADVAALESASQGALCGDQSSAQATSFAKASAMLNGFDADAAGSSLSAEVGGVLSAGGLRSFIASASNAAAANEAVHVEVTKSVPGSLVANLGGLFGGGNANVDLRAEAVARRLPNATISAGTGLASVNSGQSALLNPILSGLLGTHIDLSAAAYNGIADAKLSVLDILGPNGMGLVGVDTSLGTIEQLLNTNVGLQQVLAASVNVLAKNGVASVEALRAQLVGVKSATLKLGDLLGLSAGEVNSMSQLDTAINALDLIMAVAQVANKNSAVAVNLGIPGLASARLTVVEPKRIVSGPPGQDESGAWRTEVRQSQVRLTADIDSGFLSILATTKLQLAIEGASGAVWLKSMACTRPDTALDFGWRSSGATIKIGSPANIDQVGSILVLGGLVRLDLKLDTSIAGSSGDTRFNVKADGSDLVQSRRLPESGFLASTLKTSINVNPVVLGLCLPLLCGSTALTDLIVNSVVAPLVDGLLTPILNLVLPLLGVQLGYIDAEILKVDVGRAELLI